MGREENICYIKCIMTESQTTKQRLNSIWSERQTDEKMERERETDMYFYIKCPDVTSSEGVQPRGSTLINKVTQR